MSETPTDPSTIRLEPEFATSFADALGVAEPPETLGAAFDDATERLARVATIDATDMFQAEPTRHRVHVGTATEHVPCVLDALVVADLVAESPVHVVSESPGGESAVAFQVTDEDVTVTPETAVVSIGIAPDDQAEPVQSVDLADNPRIASCRYINAFPTDDAYESWAESTDATVKGIAGPAAVALARRAAASPLFGDPSA